MIYRLQIIDFRNVKAGELTRHVQYCERMAREAINGSQNKKPQEVDESTEDKLAKLEPEIERITRELSQLSTYVRLNHTGFVKILKKHDKHTAYMLRPTFLLRLNARPLEQLENLDALVVRLSRLYDLIRSHARGEAPMATNQIEDSGMFVRKTTKYWVHADHVTEVKCIILQHLPVLVHPSSNGQQSNPTTLLEGTRLDFAISSVYLDNDRLDLYHGRLERREGALAIRLRWYGRTFPPRLVYIERKVHREDWTGETSVKERFGLEEALINDYLAGYLRPGDIRARLARQHPEWTVEQLEKTERLAGEIQETILGMKLHPVLRTFYNRTAFQHPGDARVRISLDTELTMIREDPASRISTNSLLDVDNWVRRDLSMTHPFGSSDEKWILSFPHAVLEVKLQTQAGQVTPAWVLDKLTSPAIGLVEEVPKFSKFIHGCASLMEASAIRLEPFWLEQMDVDIRRGAAKASSKIIEQEQSKDELPQIVLEVKDDGKEPLQQDPLILESDDEEADDENSFLLNKNHRRPSLLERILGRRTNNSPVPSQNNVMAKRIHVPVRVEPKVYFANERTFLSWIHFSIFLGGISTALVGLGDRRARASGYLFALVSILFTLYALYIYKWRARRIRQRDPGPYDDRFGPYLIVTVFVAAMIANVLVVALV